MDEAALYDKVFGIIEPALMEAGYIVLEGDNDTSYVLAPDGKLHFVIMLRHLSAQEPHKQAGGSL